MRRLLLILPVLCLGCVDEPMPEPSIKNALEGNKTAAELPIGGGKAPEAGDVPQTGTFQVAFTTTAGPFTIEVDRSWAPIGAQRFHDLVSSGFYNDAGFFRVLKDFMVQFGLPADPANIARWGAISDDPVLKSNKPSYVSFATAGPNSRTTQIFINYEDNANLDDQGFSPFGRVIEGMENVRRINGQYGQTPDQGQIRTQGNTYLKKNFQDLDYVVSAKFVTEDAGGEEEAD